MSRGELVRRYLLFIVSLFCIGLGVALTKHAELGVSPMSSVANVMSVRFDFWSFGTWLTASNCLLLVGQILLLRRRFKPIQLLQIPLSFLFGYFTDLGLWLASLIPNDLYVAKLAIVLGGVVVLGFGITLGVIASVLLNSCEAFVAALADVTGKSFGNVKIAFDVSCVAISGLLSLVFFDGRLYGLREGTVISALFVGVMVKLFKRLIGERLDRVLRDPSVKQKTEK